MLAKGVPLFLLAVGIFLPLLCNISLFLLLFFGIQQPLISNLCPDFS